MYIELKKLYRDNHLEKNDPNLPNIGYCMCDYIPLTDNEIMKLVRFGIGLEPIDT